MPNSRPNIADALFTKTQQRVLGLLFGQAHRSYYLNELVGLASVGKGTVRRELDKLVSADLVTLRRQGNQTHYQANNRCPIYLELKSIIDKTVGISGVLSEALEDTLPNTVMAFVYGSIAKGTENADSDIDLMLVGDDLSYTNVVGVLLPTEEKLGRPINPTLLTPDEFKKRLIEKQSFLTRVTEQNLIWLKGQEVLEVLKANIKTDGQTA